jgi:hypothetical protein
MNEEIVLKMIKNHEISNKELQELIAKYPHLSALQVYVGTIPEQK